MQKNTDLTIFQRSFAGRIGVARRDITPPPGIYSRNWGTALHDAAEGLHRPLSLTAITFACDQEAPVVLASLDLGWWRSPEEEWVFRSDLLRQLSLDESRLIILLTHTHAGPSISGHAVDKPGGDKIRPYIEATRAVLREAIDEALATSRDAVLDWQTGRCGLACHRDQRLPNGPGSVVGYEPTVRADDTLLVGRVTDSSGVVRGTLVNYACHPTTLGWENRLISPDYIGAMRETVERATSGAPCLFLQGASGELAPRRQYTGDTEVADQNGRQLGHAVLATIADMLPPRHALKFVGVEESTARLGRWELANHSPSSKIVARSLRLDLPLQLFQRPVHVLNAAAGRDRATIERLERLAQRWIGIRESDGGKIEVWLWCLGDAIVVGVPGEMHSPFQIELRRQFSEHAVVVMNLANGSLGYFPPLADFSEPTYQCGTSMFGSGAHERILAESIEAINALIADPPAPEPSISPLFSTRKTRDKHTSPKAP
jgi:hypothetical protein